MSLPLPAIDRLFERLTATYGRQFLMLYEGLDINTVKSVWAHELSGYAANLKAIAWALESLPERAPNAIEFRALCRRAPAEEAPRIEHQPASRARVRTELAKLAPVLASMGGGIDKRDWARRILARHDAGERVRSYSLNLARAALSRGTVEEPAA